MKEKWIVQNKTKGILSLPNNGIILRKKGDIIDLVSFTGKSIAQLENDQEITIQLAYNNLITIKKENGESDVEKENLNKKLDAVVELLKETVVQPKQTIDLNDLKDYINQLAYSSNTVYSKKDLSEEMSSQEEKMREEAMRIMVKNENVNKNIKNFGKEREVEDNHEDFTDLIDL